MFHPNNTILCSIYQDRVFFMPRNELTKDEIKCHVLKLKDELYHSGYSDGITFLAHEYLNKVLDKLDEYRA